LIHSFSRSLRENEAKEGRYPQGPLNVVDSCHDSAKQASLMALTAPRVQRGMQKENRRSRRFPLSFGKPGLGLSFYNYFKKLLYI